METEHLILTLSGADRQGLVKDIAATINAHGGNWEESRLLHVGGRFVGLLDVQLPTTRAGDLRNALAGLPGLEFTFAPAQLLTPQPEFECTLELIGNDQVGIVRRITQLLQDREINIEELTTKTVSAPESGAPLFKLQARLGAQADFCLDDLAAELEALSGEIMVETNVTCSQESKT